MPSTKFQSSDGDIFPMVMKIANQYVTIKTMLADQGEDEEVVPLPNVTAAILKSQSVPVFAVPAWTSPTSSLTDIHRPVLTTGCSQDSFMSFKRKWVSYVKY